MARPKLRQPSTPGAAQASDGAPSPTPFTLAIAGVVVTRAQLVAALQPFVPGLADIEAFEDGQRFLFVFNSESGQAPTAKLDP